MFHASFIQSALSVIQRYTVFYNMGIDNHIVMFIGYVYREYFALVVETENRDEVLED
jgi:hypothetical protein